MTRRDDPERPSTSSGPSVVDPSRSTEAELERARRELRRTRDELNALRNRRAVRVALAVADHARRIRAFVRTLGRPNAGRAASAAPEGKRLRVGRREGARFRRRLTPILRTHARTDGLSVLAVVVLQDRARDPIRHLVALDGQHYRDLEIVVIDTRADRRRSPLGRFVPHHPFRVVESDPDGVTSAGLEREAAAANRDSVLFVPPGVVFAGPHVLGHMVERMMGDQTVAAVTGRSIIPRRSGPSTGPSDAAADLSLAHRGLAFDTARRPIFVHPIGYGADPFAAEAERRADVPAAPLSAMLVRCTAAAAVGWMDPDLGVDAAGVDLCLRLRSNGGRIVYEPRAVSWWHAPLDARMLGLDPAAPDGSDDWARLRDTWGPRVTRQVLLDQLRGEHAWSDRPLRVGITLTKDDVRAGYGDWHTAHELGDALTAIGWDVSYLERWHGRWYDVDPSIDVLVSLIDTLDLRLLPAGIVTIAWIRNWTHRWLERPWFDAYDLVVASSEGSKALIDAHSAHVATLMPIATNPERFRPHDVAPAERLDVIFTGSRWGERRAVEDALATLIERGWRVAVYGRGWEAVPAIAPSVRGLRPYDELPDAYAGAAIVLDDAAGPTRPYGSVNSRVFDAIATGTLVVSDNIIGMRELFGPTTPAGDSPDEIVEIVERYLADPAARRREADRLRSIVLARHTYGRRAIELRERLIQWAESRHVDIAIGVPSWDEAERWGDYHLARSLQRALHRRDHVARVRLLPDWEHPTASVADVALHLFGLSIRRRRRGQLSCLWIISHPDRVTDGLLLDQDFVFAAGDAFAQRLSSRTSRPVVALHQATDPERFRPGSSGPAHDLLYIANSRGVRRRTIEALAGRRHDVAVYGSGWTPDLLGGQQLVEEHVANASLPGYYASAKIVLNDHWPDMAAEGFLSNRLYDVAASGGFVISDAVAGLEQEFDGGIPGFSDDDELEALIVRFLADADQRERLAARSRAAVLARHTIVHRVDTMLDLIGPAIAARPATVTASSPAPAGR